MENTRNTAIDRFRGAAVLLMVLVDYLGGVNVVPAFLKHAPDVGFTTADLVAPMFIFAIGLTYGASFKKRFTAEGRRAYQRAATRYFAILGIGALLSAGGTAVAGQPSAWGVLQAIGVAGLITLVFIRLNSWARLGIGLLLLGLYQLGLDLWAKEAVLHTSHGGFFGAVSWSAMLILATVLADFYRKGFKHFLRACLVAAVLAVIAALLTPVSKNRVSASYVLVTLALSGFLFLLFERVSSRLSGKNGFLVWWGENPLALYILHLLVLGLIELPSPRWFYAGAPVWLAAVELAVLLGVVSAAAWTMHKRKIRISL